MVVATPDHVHAPATAARAAAGQARLLRKAADPHRGRSPHGRRASGQDESRHANGNANPRQRQLSPRGRDHPVGRDRPGGRSPYLGRPGLGWCRTAERYAAGAAEYPLGSVARAGAERPYNPAYLPANWRKWWDFGGGNIADMACHHMDLPFWASTCAIPRASRPRGRR